MNVEVGDAVMVREDPFEDDVPMVKATVTETLAAQFIAEWPRSTLVLSNATGTVKRRVRVTRQGFFLYTGKGSTWKAMDE